MEWHALMSGVSRRLVMDPIPVRVGLLLSGRWAEDEDGRKEERRAAITRTGGLLMNGLFLEGQREPIVARFQCFGDSLDATCLWPHLRIGPDAARVLAGRLLVYEGNHRLACARYLGWKYVLVEPRLWVWGAGPVDEIEASSAKLIADNAAVEMGDRCWRQERPVRQDQRPIRPESGDVPRFLGRCGDDVADWERRWYDRVRARQSESASRKDGDKSDRGWRAISTVP